MKIGLPCALGFATAIALIPGLQKSRAEATADSQISFSGFQMTPDSGTISLSDWSVLSIVSADGGIASDFTFAPGPVDAVGTFSEAHADSSANSPADLAVTGSASGHASLPGPTPGLETTSSTVDLENIFTISGTANPVNLTLSTTIAGLVHTFMDANGLQSFAEAKIGVSIDGVTVLFYDLPQNLLAPGETTTPIAQTLNSDPTELLNLDPTQAHLLDISLDAETQVSNVPEPSSWFAGMLMAGLAGAACLKKKISRRELNRASGLVRIISVTALVGLLLPVRNASATAVGGQAPVCTVCRGGITTDVRAPNRTSLTEGNLREDYSGPSVQPTLACDLTYDSDNADASHGLIDTGLGYGWTFSYNLFVFPQSIHMFRMDADGRTTRFHYNGGTVYPGDPGYFETLVKNSDGTYNITNKDRTVYHYALVPGTPFIVGGPVYRVQTIVDRNMNTNSMTYSGGMLSKVTDTYGRSLTFSYNAQNHLTKITDPLGRITTFTYDATGHQLTRITDPTGHSVQYTYNSQNQITTKTDREGHVFAYSYNHLLPFSATDGSGSNYFSMTNPQNWAVDRTNLAMNYTTQYLPSTTTEADGRGDSWRYDYDRNGYITRMTDPLGGTTSYAYDSSTLMVTSVTNADGFVTHYQYDTQGNRTNQTDALGNITTYTYEPVYNHMTSMTDPNGRTTAYQYDTRGNRLAEIDPLLHTNRWTYDTHGNVLSSTDKNGNTTILQYDANGNRTNRTDALGNVTTTFYDAVGNVTSVIDPRGNTTAYQYDLLNRPTNVINAASGITKYQYDGNSRQTSVTDADGHTTTSVYDTRGRDVEVIDAIGGTTTSTYDNDDNRLTITDADAHTITIQYDQLYRPTARITDLNETTTMQYDPVGNKTSQIDANGHTNMYAYDALNRVVTMTDALGGVTRYDYSVTGGAPCCTPTIGSPLVTRQQDADSHVTFYQYDELDRRVQVIRKQGDTNDVIDFNDAVTTTTYDAFGNRTSVTDPVGDTTISAYDADNRLITTINAAGDTTSYTYDPDGNPVTMTSPNGNVSTSVYDPLNRVTSVTDSIGLVTSTTYDPVGNRLSTTDGNGDTTSYAYDPLNRVVTVTDALAHTTTTMYDGVGNRTNITDRLGDSTRYVYDGDDRRISMTDPLGNITTSAYDPVGNVIGITDSNGHTTSYGYDALNRRTSQTLPDPTPDTVNYQYDAVGNMISRTDQSGQVTTYSYSDLYYITNRHYLPSGVNDNMTYDLAGRLTSADRAGWVDTFAYDGADRLVSSTQNGRTLTYSYNIPGRVQTNDYPSGREIVTVYDARSRLDTVNDNTPNPPITQYFYDDGNRVTNRNYRNGATATYAYDADNRAVSIEHSNTTGRIAGFGYTYDAEGNKLSEEKRHSTSDSETYLYDADNRLTTYKVGTLSGGVISSPAITKTWTLDGLGNWITLISNAVVQTRVFGPANELTSINGNPLTYDANGNLHNDGAYLYAYDEENRLTQVTRDSDSAIVGQYFYDALGRRIIQITDPAGTSSTNVFFYDKARIIEETDGTGAVEATFIYGNYVDEALTMDRGGQTYYYHQNALWSPGALTDSTGTPVERYSYDAYGEVSVMDGSFSAIPMNAWGTPHSAIGNFWLFTGRELDEEAGLYYYRARYYDPLNGRFIERDPITYYERLMRNPIEGNRGVNLYEGFYGNPLTYTDWNGMDNPGCDLPDFVQPVVRDCERRCCAQHDQCYFRRGCTAASWGINAAFGICSLVSPCARCNASVVACFGRCATGISPPTGPRWFCPNGPNAGTFYNNYALIPASCWENGVKPAKP